MVRDGMKNKPKNVEKNRNLKVENLIAKAADLFASKGYRQCGVQEITEHLGLSKGGFYWYFESKDDLYCRICKAHCDRCRQAFYGLVEEPGPVDPQAILVASRDLLDWFISNPMEIQLMFDFYQEIKSEAVLAQIAELGEEWQRVLAILIKRCCEQGLIATKGDPDSLARIALVFFRGLLMDFNVQRDRTLAMNDWQLFAQNLFGMGS
jgi:AcrR family transcriptional regulator